MADLRTQLARAEEFAAGAVNGADETGLLAGNTSPQDALRRTIFADTPIVKNASDREDEAIKSCEVSREAWSADTSAALRSVIPMPNPLIRRTVRNRPPRLLAFLPDRHGACGHQRVPPSPGLWLLTAGMAAVFAIRADLAGAKFLWLIACAGALGIALRAAWQALRSAKSPDRTTEGHERAVVGLQGEIGEDATPGDLEGGRTATNQPYESMNFTALDRLRAFTMRPQNPD